MIVNIEQTKKKNSRHWGLNPRPPHYKCDALPLSYSGNIYFIIFIFILLLLIILSIKLKWLP